MKERDGAAEVPPQVVGEHLAPFQAPSFGEHEPRFTHFTQNLPGLAWIKDLQGRYLYANDAARRILGAAETAIVGKTDAELFPPLTAAQFRANDQIVIIGKR